MGKSAGKRQISYIRQGGVIALAMLFVGLCTLLKQCILTSRWGDYGNAMYSTAFETYMLLSAFTVFAFPEAMRIFLKPRVKQGKYANIASACHLGLIFGLLVGLIGMAALFLGRHIIAELLCKSPLAGAAMMILAPFFFFSCLNGILRGIFLGYGIKGPVAVSYLFEQCMVLVVGFPMSSLFQHYGSKVAALLMNDGYVGAFSVAGFMIGYLIGSCLTFVFLMVLYIFSGNVVRSSLSAYAQDEEYGYVALDDARGKKKRKKNKQVSESKAQLIPIFLRFLLPISLYEFFQKGILFCDQLLFSIVSSKHLSDDVIQQQWGIYYGKYKTLTLIPVVVVAAMTYFLNNRIQQWNKKHEYDRVRDCVSKLVRGVQITVIPLCVSMVVLSDIINSGLFGASDSPIAQRILIVGAVSALFYSMAMVWLQVLLGQKTSGILLMFCGIFALAIHFIGIYVMLTNVQLDINSVLYSDILLAFILCIIGEVMVHKRIRLRESVWFPMIPLLIAAAIMGFIQFLLSKAFAGIIPGLMLIIILLLLGYVIYFGVLCMIRAVDASELRRIPMGGFASIISHLLGRN